MIDSLPVFKQISTSLVPEQTWRVTLMVTNLSANEFIEDSNKHRLNTPHMYMYNAVIQGALLRRVGLAYVCGSKISNHIIYAMLIEKPT
jgi:hypothetical protein